MFRDVEMTDEQEIKRILQDHEERLEKLELLPSSFKATSQIPAKKFEGLIGGINFLMEQNFFTGLKSADKIWTELKREGYVYPKKSVMKILNVDFVNKKKILNRIKENDVWKYCLRK